MMQKYLLETNLPDTLNTDYRSVFTDEVKTAFLAFAHGEKNSSPKAEQDYVLAKFKKSREELPDEITVVPEYDINAYIKNGYNCIHVNSNTGADTNSGSEEHPLATIESAIKKARAGVPTAIVIHAGTYAISDTIEITQKLTGTPDAPFIITSADDGEVVISATKQITFSYFLCGDFR